MAGRRLLILGGGFGGLDVARAIGRSRAAREYWDTLLIDKENFFQFNPLLPAVAVGAVETRHSGCSTSWFNGRRASEAGPEAAG